MPPGLFLAPSMEPDPEARRKGQLKRVAQERGLLLVEPTSLPPDSPLYGTYTLIDPSTEEIVHKGLDTHTYGLSLDDVAKCLGVHVSE